MNLVYFFPLFFLLQANFFCSLSSLTIFSMSLFVSFLGIGVVGVKQKFGCGQPNSVAGMSGREAHITHDFLCSSMREINKFRICQISYYILSPPLPSPPRG